ncbi:MAG TPA: hypothetical protein VNZ94_13955 [Xanthobacteraceae bacterium]|nr:hypothetical protein [Xanthobacteraceae bacterium]
MADYYPLIARAVAGLDSTATGESRRALYERARSALITQLRGVQPPLTESEITRERLSLEEAIRKVEAEAAQRGRPDGRPAAAPPTPTPPPAPEGPQKPRSGDAFRAATTRARSTPLSSGGTARPASETRARPLTPLSDQPSLPETRLPRVPRPIPPPVAPRPETPAAAAVEPTATERAGLRDLRDAAAGPEQPEAPAPKANRPARRSFTGAPAPSPSSEFDRLEAGLDERVAGPAAARRGPGPGMESPANGKGRPPKAAKPPRLPSGRKFPTALMIVLGLLMVLGGLVIWQWPKISEVARTYMGPTNKIAQAPKDTGPAVRPKITDRVGQPSSSQTIAPVAQRVVLYDEDPAQPQGKQYVGTVVWRTEEVKGSGSQPDLAIRADVEIPERKFKMTLSLRRNTDQSLPASHTAELNFTLPPDFDSGGIANVPGILMKSNEQARGTPLAGLAVKVTDNFFLIGLSNVDVDRARNIQLLKERSWFDVPLVYANQRRAILAIEKGEPGERAFQDAFRAWGE